MTGARHRLEGAGRAPRPYHGHHPFVPASARVVEARGARTVLSWEVVVRYWVSRAEADGADLV
jgi:hypothetical protein